MKGENMENGQNVAGYVYTTPENYANIVGASIKLDTLLRTIADAWIDTADKAWMPEPPESVLALMRVWDPDLYCEAKQKADEIKAQKRAEEQDDGGNDVRDDL